MGEDVRPEERYFEARRASFTGPCARDFWWSCSESGTALRQPRQSPSNLRNYHVAAAVKERLRAANRIVFLAHSFTMSYNQYGGQYNPALSSSNQGIPFLTS